MSKARLTALAMVLTLVSAGAYAAKSPTKSENVAHTAHKFKVSKAYPTASFQPLSWPVGGEIPTLKEKIKKFEKRGLASDYSASDKDLSDKLKEIRTQFLQIKTADALDAEIKALTADATYATLPPDAQYVAAQLAILVPFRGIVYKTTQLAVSTHGTDTMAYYGITQVASLMSVLLPTDQWQAVFDYLVGQDPANPGQFQGMSYIQDYLVTSVLPVLDKASARLAELGKNMGDTPFFFDRLFLYGTANFQDDVDNYKFRYKMVGPAEIAGALASIQFSMHDIYVFSSYNLENYIDVKHGMAKLFATQGILLGNMENLVAQNRVHVITGTGSLFNRGYAAYLTARGDTDNTHPQAGWYAKEQMAQALTHLRNGVTDLRLAWGVVQSEKDYDLANQYAMFRPVRILPNSQAIELRVKTLEDMVAGQTAVKSFVTGETITVNVPNYYENPPSDLKAFLPYDFAPKDKTRSAKYFRDYYYGRPTAWHLDKYAPYVEIPSGAQNSYIQNVARVMEQSWAGLELAVPLLAVVR